jgi:5'-nucleotidase
MKKGRGNMPSINPGARLRWRPLALLAIFAMVAALLAGAGPATAEDHEVDFWLTIMHNNDGESQLLPSVVLDEDDNVIGTEGGVAYFASVRFTAETMANKKPEGDDTKRGAIFVSSGDNFLAGPTFTASVEDGIWYDALALDMLKYDAIDLGNHDFDFGPDVLEAFISDGFRKPGNPPYLSSNLDFSGESGLQALVDDGVIAKSTIVKEKGERIGIIGATTENLSFISSPRNVVVNAVLPAVQAEVDFLEAMGIDKIVLISHLQDIDGDVALAEQLTGVDVMIAGGGDELLANPDDPLLPSDGPGDVFGAYPQIAVDSDGNDVPVVTTSGNYGYVGHLTVGFDDGAVVAVDDDRSGPLRVVSESIGPDGVKPRRVFQTRVTDPVAEFVADLAANIIATSEVDLDGRRNAVRSVETNEGNLIADALRWQADQLAAEFGVPSPDVALQNGGGIRNDSIIPAGPISELDTFAMVPFPNFLTVFPAIPRAQFKEILENAVSGVDDPPPAPPGGSGRFAQVSGFSFQWDQLQPVGSKVKNVVLDDATVIVDGAGVVVAGADLTVATIDFLARGGDEYPFGAAPFTVLGASYQQALSNYIQAATADGGLGGVISAADYPEGGEGRITRFN